MLKYYPIGIYIFICLTPIKGKCPHVLFYTFKKGIKGKQSNGLWLFIDLYTFVNLKIKLSMRVYYRLR